MTLEEILDRKFEELDKPDINRPMHINDTDVIGNVKEFLTSIREKDSDLYAHSVRTAITASELVGYKMEVLERPGVKYQKGTLIAGCLHDLGKIKLSSELLKKDRFTEQDYIEMRKHVEYSWQMVSDIFPFAAEIIITHHLFQEKPYPLELPQPKTDLPMHIRYMARVCGKYLAVADQHDSLLYRINERTGNRKLTDEEVRKELKEKLCNLREARIKPEAIDSFYELGILGSRDWS